MSGWGSGRCAPPTRRARASSSPASCTSRSGGCWPGRRRAGGAGRGPPRRAPPDAGADWARGVRITPGRCSDEPSSAARASRARPAPAPLSGSPVATRRWPGERRTPREPAVPGRSGAVPRVPAGPGRRVAARGRRAAGARPGPDGRAGAAQRRPRPERLRQPRAAGDPAPRTGSAAATPRWPPSSATARCAPQGLLDAVIERLHRPPAAPDRARRCSTRCASAPTSCCAPASRRTPRSRPPSSWSGSSRLALGGLRQRRAAPGRRARRGGLGRAAGPGPDADPVGTPRSRTRTRAGSRGLRGRARRPEPARSWTRRSPRTTRAPPCTCVARPGGISAEELALVTGGDAGPVLALRGAPRPGGDPGHLDAVRDGLAAVQDEGSQLVRAGAGARAASTAPDDAWLDLCAGPGGKAALLGALARSSGGAAGRRASRAGTAPTWCAAPSRAAGHRARRRRPRVRRCPTRPSTACCVDAPCTGLGALRRRPEARWRRSPDDVAGADAAAARAARRRAAARPARAAWSPTSPARRTWPRPWAWSAAVLAGRRRARSTPARSLPGVPMLGDGPTVQLWPHRHGTDAMFLALLRR